MEKITFCINNSCNEKPYIELLLQSLLNGIDVNLHDIIIFVDSDNQDTTQMLVEQKRLFPNLTIIKNEGEPVGYAGNINYLFQYAKTDILSYTQSDMVVPLGYVEKLLPNIAHNRILCSTRCEPPIHAQSDNAITYVRNFGLTPGDFQYENFLRFAEANKNPNKLTDYFFAPFTLYKKDWIDHDVTFKKSREDSDIALRFALKGVEMKQTWDAVVYHFTCTSSRGIEWWKQENKDKEIIRQQNDAIEMKRFVDKWGTFMHPTSHQDVKPYLETHPDIMKNIVVKNPPIDESKFVYLYP